MFAANELLDAVLYVAELLLFKILTQDVALFAFLVIQREWWANGAQQLISIIDLSREFSDYLLVLISVPFCSPPSSEIWTCGDQLLDCRTLKLACAVRDHHLTFRPFFEIPHRRRCLPVFRHIGLRKHVLLLDPVKLLQDYAFGYFVWFYGLFRLPMIGVCLRSYVFGRGFERGPVFSFRCLLVPPVVKIDLIALVDAIKVFSLDFRSARWGCPYARIVRAAFGHNHQFSLLDFEEWLIHLRESPSLTRQLRSTTTMESLGCPEHLYLPFAEYLRRKPWHHGRRRESVATRLFGRHELSQLRRQVLHIYLNKRLQINYFLKFRRLSCPFRPLLKVRAWRWWVDPADS